MQNLHEKASCSRGVVAVKSGGHEKRFLTIRFFISRHMRTFFSDVIFNSGHS